MKRKEEWKQDNPRDQLRVLLGAIEGDLSNMREGIGNPTIQLGRMYTFLREAQQIASDLPPGEWESLYDKDDAGGG